MSNQPVYRYPPRSHVYNCPCPRCVQCRSRPSPGSDLIKFDMGCLGVVLVFAAVSGIAGWIGRNSHVALEVLPGIGVLALIVWAVVFVNRRAARPPKGRLRVEATTPGQLRPPPASVCVPRCLHLNAVRVNSVLDSALVYRCWCPDCDPDCKRPLPAGFRLPCCGTVPGDGTKPAVHVYNCPHRKGTPP